eukprot:g20134.t2
MRPSGPLLRPHGVAIRDLLRQPCPFGAESLGRHALPIEWVGLLVSDTRIDGFDDAKATDLKFYTPPDLMGFIISAGVVMILLLLAVFWSLIVRFCDCTACLKRKMQWLQELTNREEEMSASHSQMLPALQDDAEVEVVETTVARPSFRPSATVDTVGTIGEEKYGGRGASDQPRAGACARGFADPPRGGPAAGDGGGREAWEGKKGGPGTGVPEDIHPNFKVGNLNRYAVMAEEARKQKCSFSANQHPHELERLFTGGTTKDPLPPSIHLPPSIPGSQGSTSRPSTAGPQTMEAWARPPSAKRRVPGRPQSASARPGSGRGRPGSAARPGSAMRPQSAVRPQSALRPGSAMRPMIPPSTPAKIEALGAMASRWTPEDAKLAIPKGSWLRQVRRRLLGAWLSWKRSSELRDLSCRLCRNSGRRHNNGQMTEELQLSTKAPERSRSSGSRGPEPAPVGQGLTQSGLSLTAEELERLIQDSWLGGKPKVLDPPDGCRALTIAACWGAARAARAHAVARLAGRAAQSPFEIRDVPGKGLGAVAVRDLAEGELVIEERPPPGEDGGCQGWCRGEQFWDDEMFRQKLFACKDIKKGEELCFSYLEPFLPYTQREEIFRRRILPGSQSLMGIKAVWMFGHVHCALTFGIGIRGQNGAVYVAPRHEVHPDVLQEVGLGGSLAKVRVAFQADERPGAWEQEGFNRAKMVFPGLFFDPVPIEPSADLAAHEQPRVDGRWDGWDELRVAQLRQEMDQAVIAEDGSRLCESFMQELLQLCDEEGLALQGFRAQASYHAFQCLLLARRPAEEALPWIHLARSQLQKSRGADHPDVRVLRGYEEQPLSHPAATDEQIDWSSIVPAALMALVKGSGTFELKVVEPPGSTSSSQAQRAPVESALATLAAAWSKTPEARIALERTRVEVPLPWISSTRNIPKTRSTYCRKCKKHTTHKVSQYKTGKASKTAQGKRRYDKKQAGYGGQTKPIFHKKAKTTKKIVLKFECSKCKAKRMKPIKRTKHFELGTDSKKGKNEYGGKSGAYIEAIQVLNRALLLEKSPRALAARAAARRALLQREEAVNDYTAAFKLDPAAASPGCIGAPERTHVLSGSLPRGWFEWTGTEWAKLPSSGVTSFGPISAPLRIINLYDFWRTMINTSYVERRQLEYTVNSRETYWSVDGALFIYWCPKESRWRGCRSQDLRTVQQGESVALFGAPRGNDILSLKTGWHELQNKEWVVANAGVNIEPKSLRKRTVTLVGFSAEGVNTTYRENRQKESFSRHTSCLKKLNMSTCWRCVYTKGLCTSEEMMVNDREIYCSEGPNAHFLYWSKAESRWKGTVLSNHQKIQGGRSSAIIGAPQLADLFDPAPLRGWHDARRTTLRPEWTGDDWVYRVRAGVGSLGTLRDDYVAKAAKAKVPPAKRRKTHEAPRNGLSREQLIQEVFKHFDKDGDQLLNASDMLSFAAWCQPQWLDVACHDFSTLHAFSPDSSQKMHVIETAWLTADAFRFVLGSTVPLSPGRSIASSAKALAARRIRALTLHPSSSW